MSNAPEKAPAEKSSSKKNLVFVIIIAILMLLIGAMASGWYFAQQNAYHATNSKEPGSKETEKEAEKENVKEAKIPVTLALDPAFVVNLQSADGQQQFLQTGLILLFFEAEQMDSIKPYLAQIRSQLLILLSSKHAEELMNAEGKEKLKKEIVDQIKKILPPKHPAQKIKGVLFSSFVIQ